MAVSPYLYPSHSDDKSPYQSWMVWYMPEMPTLVGSSVAWVRSWVQFLLHQKNSTKEGPRSFSDHCSYPGRACSNIDVLQPALPWDQNTRSCSSKALQPTCVLELIHESSAGRMVGWQSQVCGHVDTQIFFLRFCKDN